jgi:virginiamycin B lyase
VPRIPLRRLLTMVSLVACSAFTLAQAGGARAAGGVLEEVRVPTALAHPTGMATGPDGAMWFTESATNKIGRLANGVFREYPLPRGGSPTAITAGPDGALWFTESGASRVGRIATDGAITEYPVPVCAGCSDGGQSDIAIGSDGHVWFTSTYGNAIGRMSLGGRARWFALPSAEAAPVSIAAGPDGALWFGDAHGVGRMTTGGTSAQIWSGPYSPAVTEGPDKRIWFSTSTIDQVGRLDPVTRSVRFFPIHTNCYPSDLAAGAHGVWFGCYYRDEVDEISTGGALTSFPVPSHFGGQYPDSISGVAVKPNGSVWFAEEAANRIGRLIPGLGW